MEVTGTHEAIEIADASAVGEVRRRAHAIAYGAGLDEIRAGEVALIATEAASNVVKHAGHGGALLATLAMGGARGVSITVWDRGPGMDLERCLRDGMSSAGTSGHGLGAIGRLASWWDAYTRAGLGTVLTASILPHGAAPPLIDVGGVCVPIRGEIECGDAWDAYLDGASASLVVCDGLGHGAGAAVASAAVTAAFRDRPTDVASEILARADRAARSTRGAAAAVVRIDRATRAVTLAGVGNVAPFVWTDDRLRPMVTQHGTLGQVMPSLRDERFVLAPGALIVMCTDGLKSRLGVEAYPGLASRSAATIAAVLWRDFARERDDATIAVLRLEPRP